MALFQLKDGSVIEVEDGAYREVSVEELQEKLAHVQSKEVELQALLLQVDVAPVETVSEAQSEVSTVDTTPVADQPVASVGQPQVDQPATDVQPTPIVIQ